MIRLKYIGLFFIFVLSACQTTSQDKPVETKDRIKELDALWAEVSRSVREGDFEAYKATCHTEGVLVAGVVNKAYPLSQALEKWKQEFVDTKNGVRQSNVEFRFSRRMGDATTAYEEGIFLYTAKTKEGKDIAEYINFDALLVKQASGWKIIMESQKSRATILDWLHLKHLNKKPCCNE